MGLQRYKSTTPLRSSDRWYKADVKAVLASSHKVELTDKLLAKRQADHFADRIDRMISEMTGLRNPAKHRYDNRATQQLEHLQDHPLDPTTQVPLWRELLAATKGTTVSRRLS